MKQSRIKRIKNFISLRTSFAQKMGATFYRGSKPEISSSNAPIQNGDAEIASALFDSKWYIFKYPDITDRSSALEHYLNYGWKEDRWPHPLFDPSYYRRQVGHDEGAVENPLLHYLHSKSDASPHPLFDQKWYENRYMRDAVFTNRPLVHLSTHGVLQNNNPCALFDSFWYSEQHPDISELGWPPPYHYAQFGWRSGASPNSMFNAKWYLQKYLGGQSGMIDPLQHYQTVGRYSGNSASAEFDAGIYYRLHPDVEACGVEALAHYLEFGIKEHRKINVDYESIQNFDELKLAFRGTGAAFRERCIELTLPLRIAEEVQPSPYEMIYRSPAITAEGIGVLAQYIEHPAVLKINNSFAVAGSRFVIDDSGFILHEEEAFFFNDEKVPAKWHRAKRIRHGRMSVRCHLRAGYSISSGINMMHEHSENYFHFIAETLPRMLLVEEAGIPKDIPLIFESGLHRNLGELISLMNVDKRPIIWLETGSLCHFQTMYFPGNVSCVPNSLGGGDAATMTSLDVARITKAIHRCKGNVAESASFGSKVYISRHGRMRNVLNQSELQAALTRHGFHVRTVEGMDLQTQIRIFSSADLLISPTGAQLTNIVWCKPGTILNYLVGKNPSMQLHLWGLLGRVSGTTVVWTEGPQAGKITGEYAVHDDFTIDKDLLLGWIEQQELENDNHGPTDASIA